MKSVASVTPAIEEVHVLPKITDGGSPLYRQIASLMRRRMRSGQWPVGMQLPTLAQLAEQLSVARVTVRQAMDLLEAERLIFRRQGKGTFVTSLAVDTHWLSVATKWEDLVKLIAGTESKCIESVDSANFPPVTPEEGTFAPGYRFLRKLNSYEGQPHLLLEIYLDSAVYIRAVDEFEFGPIIPVLDALPRLKIGKANESLTVGVADPEVATLLNIAVGAPVVEVRRIIRYMNSTILYFGHLTYRADGFRMEIQLRD